MKKIVFSVLILFSFACKDYAENTSPLHEIYEMRVYYTYEGRFDNILSRFENHTVKLFEKHGFNNVGYWTTEKKDSISFADEFIFENGGKPALVYIVSFQNMDIRGKNESMNPRYNIKYNYFFLLKTALAVSVVFFAIYSKGTL